MIEGYAFFENMEIVGIGITEIVVALVVILMIFGSGKLREFLKSQIRTQRIFQKSLQEKNIND